MHRPRAVAVGMLCAWLLPATAARSEETVPTYWGPVEEGSRIAVLADGGSAREGTPALWVRPGRLQSPAWGSAASGTPEILWGRYRGLTPPVDWIVECGGVIHEGQAAAGSGWIEVEQSLRGAGEVPLRVEVRDALGRTLADSTRLWLEDGDSEGLARAAVEKGLHYLARRQLLDSRPDLDGGWHGSRTNVQALVATALSLQAFARAGHLATLDESVSAYAPTVRAGRDWLLRGMVARELPPEFDGNGDGEGWVFLNNVPAHSQALGALLALGGLDEAAGDGPWAGRSLAEHVQNAIDQLAWAQADDPLEKGGWRYDLLAGDAGAENVAGLWPALALGEALVQQRVQLPAELALSLSGWLDATRHADGGFLYRTIDPRRSLATAAGGLAQHSLLDAGADRPGLSATLDWLAARWTAPNGQDISWPRLFDGNIYEMATISLALGSLRPVPAAIGWRDWRGEFREHLLFHENWGQREDGHWDGGTPLPQSSTPELNTALALLTLLPGDGRLLPVARIQPVGTVGIGDGIRLDGSASWHSDPERTIATWQWDFDPSDGLAFTDGEGANLVHPGYADAGGRQIALRVVDDGQPPLSAVAFAWIEVVDGDRPPLAVSDGPWCAAPGEPLLFDGTGSWDPDEGDRVAAWEWDLDGDGLFDDAFGPWATGSWLEPWHGVVGLRVLDQSGRANENGGYHELHVTAADLELAAARLTGAADPDGTTLQVEPGQPFQIEIDWNLALDPGDAPAWMRIRLLDLDRPQDAPLLDRQRANPTAGGHSESFALLAPLSAGYHRLALELAMSAPECDGANQSAELGLLVTSTVDADEAPRDFRFGAAWPNPFNPTVTLPLHLPATAAVRVVVHDLAGREVAVLHDGALAAGLHEFQWRAGDKASGLYVCRAECGGEQTGVKLMLIK